MEELNKIQVEQKEIEEKLSKRVNLELLKQLDTDNLIDYSKYS